MTLLEIFDTKVDYKVTQARAGKFNAEAKIGGRVIEFTAVNLGPNPAGPWKDSATGDVWDVDFSEVAEKHFRGRTWRITGNGEEFKVFAMVRAAMNEFIETYKPDVICFSAGKDNEKRASLYRKVFVKPLAKEYASRESDSSQKVNFWLERK